MRTRIGNADSRRRFQREMIGALRIKHQVLYTLGVRIGAALAAWPVLMQAPI